MQRHVLVFKASFIKIYPNFEETRLKSFDLEIETKTQNLVYYPVYIIHYSYRNARFTCYLDGLTGSIFGERQFSAVKVTIATALLFYPALKIAVFAFGTLVSHSFAFEVAENISFISTLPIALIIGPFLGAFARSYSKKHRKAHNSTRWENDQQILAKFTYRFKSTDQINKVFIRLL